GLAWDGVEMVQTTRLDALIRRYGMPAFIKIDIEGGELSALDGLTVPVPALSLEFTPEYSGAGVECVKRLQKIGDYRFNFSFGDDATLHLAEWLPRTAFLDSPRTIEGRGDIFARLSHAAEAQAELAKNV